MRTCPNCKSQINNPLSSFCFDCGTKLKLSEEIMDKEAEEKKDLLTEKKLDEVTTKSLPSKHFAYLKTKNWTSFILGSNALSLIFLLFTVGVFFRTNYASNIKILTPVINVDNVEIVKDDIKVNLTEEVLNSKLSDIIPENIILYTESSGLDIFLENLLSDTQKKYIEDSYELKFSEFLIFMRPSFAFVRKNNDNWAVVTKTGGVDFFERTYAKYQKNKTKDAKLFTSRVGEFLVISNDMEFILQMEDVNSKISLGLKNNANFLRSVGSVGGYPVFFAYSPSSDYLATNLEEDLKIFELNNLIDYLGKIEGAGVYVIKDSTGYSVSQLN